MNKLRLWSPSLLGVAALLALLLVQATEFKLVRTLRHVQFDGYQSVFSQREPVSPGETLPVVVVAIDEESLARLGQWPWSRKTLSDLLTALHEAGAGVVAFDLLFAEVDRSSPARVLPMVPGLSARLGDMSLPDYDRAFAHAIRAGRTVLGQALSHGSEVLKEGSNPVGKVGFALVGEVDAGQFRSFDQVIANLPMLERAALGLGAMNIIPGDDGVVRKEALLFRAGDRWVPGLVAETLRVAVGARGYVLKGRKPEEGLAAMQLKIGPLVIAMNQDGEVWLDFASHVPVQVVPAWRVLDGHVAPESLAHAVVFVGATAAGLHDTVATPGGARQPGVMVHARAFYQGAMGEYLHRPVWAKLAELSLALLTGVVVFLVLAVWGGGAATLVLVGFVVAYASAGGYGFLQERWLLDTVNGSLALIFSFSLALAVRQVLLEKQRRFIYRAFSSYVAPRFVNYLVEHPDMLQLNGEKRECSFLFTDLADFTPLLERFDPVSLVALINEYLDAMSAIAVRHDGMVSRIVGDAFAVMFSAPVEQKDHCTRAIACAREMDTFAEGFRKRKLAQGVPLGITRIGVHTGYVVLGNFGGRYQLDYRAFGDAINTAARMESINKHLGTRVAISAVTAVKAVGFTGRPVGDLVFKGKSRAISVMEPLTGEEARSERVLRYGRAFALMVREDASAVEAFRKLLRDFPDDPLVRFHCDRLVRGEVGVHIVFREK